jgi:hypothetical protein
MNITQQQLMNHPLMAKVAAELEETRAQQQTQRALDQSEAQRVRAEQGQRLVSEYKAAIREYERMRVDLHAVVGRVWAAVQAYGHLTGTHPLDFTEQIFNTINVPSLIPSTSPWAMSNGFTTTQAAAMGSQATFGKTWPAA